MKMEKTCLSAVIVFLAFNLAIGDKTHVFQVTKHLENGMLLPESLWSTFTIDCPVENGLQLTVDTPLLRPNITVYLANEEKNILELSLKRAALVGYKYETPYGEKKTVEGPYIFRPSENKIEVHIPMEWLPKNVTRMSASIKVDENVYNYYGIFNRPISLEDTMVVEEFKKVKLC